MRNEQTTNFICFRFGKQRQVFLWYYGCIGRPLYPIFNINMLWWTANVSTKFEDESFIFTTRYYMQIDWRTDRHASIVSTFNAGQKCIHFMESLKFPFELKWIINDAHLHGFNWQHIHDRNVRIDRRAILSYLVYMPRHNLNYLSKFVYRKVRIIFFTFLYAILKGLNNSSFGSRPW